MTAYYNEIEPYAVAWLRELIREGVIADGVVDDRSIEAVEPGDLNGFSQCHFFAGVGVWSYALRQSGWPDDRPVWTGSCPCQPFSIAGEEAGFADPRHLWPAWFRLARIHRPDSVFGEQVERAIRLGWFDLVSSDMEGEGYAVGSTVFGSHSVGAPHQRQRLYFVADRTRGLSDADGMGRGRRRPSEEGAEPRAVERPERLRDVGGIHDAERTRLERHDGYVDHWDQPRRLRAFAAGSTTPTGILGGFWDGAEWVECTDGKARPVEPGSFPLAHGSPARVGRLRGYGNAINAEAAIAFIEAFREVKGEL